MVCACLVALSICSCDDPVRTVPEGHPRNFNALRWSTDTLTDGGSPLVLVALDGQKLTALDAVGMTADSQAVIVAFDGTTWTVDHRYAGPSMLRDIATAGTIDRWAVGTSQDSALIVRNTGAGWTIVSHPSLPPLNAVDALSSTDVWCAGDRGVIVHATLFDWQLFHIGDGLTVEAIAELAPFAVYALARRVTRVSPFDPPYYLYRFNGAVWSRVDSIPPPNIGLPQRFGPRLYEKLSRLYSLGPGVFFLDVFDWQQQVVADTLTGMYLQDANNIVAVGTGVYHFDGVQWYSYAPFAGRTVRWRDAWMDGSNVMILGSVDGKAVVERGE